ncbi:MAG TPA: S-methyl-5-thioribose-1-phosphate isomerase [Polyangiaceae bacterium]|nr:S-methyl-5-thioribose-1-phosphate isomerase [Polyangiaceae bacterium]
MCDVPHPEPISGTCYSAVELSMDNSTVWVLDQRKVPASVEYRGVRKVDGLIESIRDMLVRGAPAIGIAAAYGAVLAAWQAASLAEFELLLERIAAARPTAVNLRWAVNQMLSARRRCASDQRAEVVAAMAEQARQIHRADVDANRRMGRLGAEFVPDGAVILTHCNAGALATGGYGTALGVIRAARDAGKKISVIADETRPWLQGARLTAWELQKDGIEVTVIADGAAASLFAKGQIDLAVVGADRIARNGDVANKIGTYNVACLCHCHSRPLYVAAPWSTVDLHTASGAEITIEERAESEITEWHGVRHAPIGVPAKNPSFDVTPARLVSGLFTERGVVSPLTEQGLVALAS